MKDKGITIDEYGLMYINGQKIADPISGQKITQNIQYAENGAWVSEYQGEPYYIEAFDEPIVAEHFLYEDGCCKIKTPYHDSFKFAPESLVLDEWDRFHGKTTYKVPFVFSAQAQDEFFDFLDEFDDESITIKGKKISVNLYWSEHQEVEKEKFWTDRYVKHETGWDLGQPSPGFKEYFPQIKLPPSRIIVLGGGKGHDAAYFASLGHFVTLVDLSPEAIKEAQTKYGHISNLKFFEGDVFKLPESFQGNFDVVVEHTCYCAINPQLRNKLVKVWNQLLSPGGYLFGVFFSMEKRQGPPFGGSEWELRERLQSKYRFLYWQRMRNSIDRRNGKEFLVYAQKKV